ncbi:MAG: serine/threonine protein kinase [Ktedonobacteraceae bacterium]
MPDLVGQQLGNYRLTQLLGRGGYAEVYLGEHVRLNTLAAIKVLLTRLASSEEVDSFQNEGRIIASLIHPHIVRVFDFDVQHDLPFMVMDYAPDGNLRKRHPKGEKLPLTTILPYVKQVADALQYAHNRRLIHRDIKPENMLLGRNGEVLLSDFGTALVAQATGYQRTLQEVIGTVSYMAPEQFQGQARPASDQYALAVVVYEWLGGDVPFHGSGTEIAIQHTMTPPPSLREKAPGISPLVEQVIMRALTKDYHQRFPGMQDFANALEQAGNSFYSERTVAVPSLAPGALPGTDEHLLHPQSRPATPPVMKASPLAMDTVTSEAAHVAPPPPGQPVLTPPPQYAPFSAPFSYQEKVRPRRRRLVPLALLLLAFLLIVGGAIVWFVIPRTPVTPGGSPLPGQQAPVYPNVTGAYSGTIHNTAAGIVTSMNLSMQQNQGNISGQFTVRPPLTGNGPFTGHIDTTRHIQFTVQGFEGNAPLFFRGLVQSDGSMAGNYCSLGANSQCSPQAGGAGSWRVSRQSGIIPLNVTPTVKENANANTKHKGKKRR